MTKRVVHLLPNSVLWEQSSKTRCGKTIGSIRSMNQDIAECSNLTVTRHGTLVTCKGCLKKMGTGERCGQTDTHCRHGNRWDDHCEGCGRVML